MRNRIMNSPRSGLIDATTDKFSSKPAGLSPSNLFMVDSFIEMD